MGLKEELKKYWRAELDNIDPDSGVDWDIDDPLMFEQYLLSSLEDYSICEGCKYHNTIDNNCTEASRDRQMCIMRLLAYLKQDGEN
jgi:hypothetical protein